MKKVLLIENGLGFVSEVIDEMMIGVVNENQRMGNVDIFILIVILDILIENVHMMINILGFVDEGIDEMIVGLV